MADDPAIERLSDRAYMTLGRLGISKKLTANDRADVREALRALDRLQAHTDLSDPAVRRELRRRLAEASNDEPGGMGT